MVCPLRQCGSSELGKLRRTGKNLSERPSANLVGVDIKDLLGSGVDENHRTRRIETHETRRHAPDDVRSPMPRSRRLELSRADGAPGARALCLSTERRRLETSSTENSLSSWSSGPDSESSLATERASATSLRCGASMLLRNKTIASSTRLSAETWYTSVMRNWRFVSAKRGAGTSIRRIRPGSSELRGFVRTRYPKARA